MSALDRNMTQPISAGWLPIVVVNAPPVFTSQPILIADINGDYNYSPVVTDADGDAITIIATVLPSWMAFNGIQITGNTVGALAGSYPVTLQASDGSVTVEQTFYVDVPVTQAIPGKHFPIHLVTVQKTDRAPTPMPALSLGSEVDYGFDWTKWLPELDTISSSIWSVEPNLTLATAYLSGVITSVMVSNGALKTDYVLQNTIVTSQGRTVVRSIAFTTRIK